jgi:hypothetical protein
MFCALDDVVFTAASVTSAAEQSFLGIDEEECLSSRGGLRTPAVPAELEAVSKLRECDYPRSTPQMSPVCCSPWRHIKTPRTVVTLRAVSLTPPLPMDLNVKAAQVDRMLF